MSPHLPSDHEREIPLEPEHEAASRQPAAPPDHLIRDTIEYDIECPTCGYNCRGIPRGSRCPECGSDPFAGRALRDINVAAPPLRKLVDAIGAAGPAERRRWQLGLTLATLCILGAVIARMMYFSTAFAGGVAAPAREYLIFGLLNSAVWTAAVLMILPASLNRHWPRLRQVRLGILLTQLLWVPAYVCWMFDVLGGPANPAFVTAAQYLLRGTAGLGFIALGQFMVFICEEAGLETAARRFNAASWLIAIPALLGQAFVGNIPWIALVLLFFVLAAWCWLLLLYALGFWEMRQHVRWHARHIVEAAGRDERVAEKRKHYEATAAGRVRPVPARPVEDEPLT